VSDTKSLTDVEIMSRVAAYDSKALEQLYDRYAPILYTLIKKIITEKETAEEVLSEVFVMVWRQIEQFDFNTNNVYTWLVTLARNKAIDVVNRSSGKPMAEYNDEYERENILPKLSPEIEALELQDVMLKKEKLEKALGSLTDAQKYVLELSYYGGMDQAEIATKLNIPPVTVKSKLQVAFGNLMKKVTEAK
jgi:RNA polymerase sigma-70 factor (ECF subfamily)